MRYMATAIVHGEDREDAARMLAEQLEEIAEEGREARSLGPVEELTLEPLREDLERRRAVEERALRAV